MACPNALSNDQLSIDQVAHFTGIPISTIRKYVAKYAAFLDLPRGDKNRLLFDRSNIEQLVNIRAWAGERKKPKEIRGLLKAGQVVKQNPGEDVLPVHVSCGQDAQSGQIDQRMPILLARMDNLTALVREQIRHIQSLEDDLSMLKSAHQDISRSVDLLSRGGFFQRLRWLFCGTKKC